MKRNRFLLLLLPVLTLILELLPYGAVLNWANPEGMPWRCTYSYFDLIPFGMANFTPLITGVITCVILILLLIFCITGKRPIVRAAKNLLAVGTVCSLGPLMFGISYLSLVGVLITLSLAVEFVVLLVFLRKPE